MLAIRLSRIFWWSANENEVHYLDLEKVLKNAKCNPKYIPWDPKLALSDWKSFQSCFLWINKISRFHITQKIRQIEVNNAENGGNLCDLTNNFCAPFCFLKNSYFFFSSFFMLNFPFEFLISSIFPLILLIFLLFLAWWQHQEGIPGGCPYGPRVWPHGSSLS